MAEDDKEAIFLQTSLAMAALAVSYVKTLQEFLPPDEALVILQRKVQGEQTRLRQTPDASDAAAMFRFVIEKLRDPDVIEQPED